MKIEKNILAALAGAAVTQIGNGNWKIDGANDPTAAVETLVSNLIDGTPDAAAAQHAALTIAECFMADCPDIDVDADWKKELFNLCIDVDVTSQIDIEGLAA